MRGYKRTTRECSFNALTPEIVAAIRKYVATNDFGNIEAELLMCVETSSEKLKQGFSQRFSAAEITP